MIKIYKVNKRIISTVKDAKNVCGRIKRLDEKIADFSNVDHITSSAAKKIIELSDEYNIQLKNIDKDILHTFSKISKEFEKIYQNNE